MDSLLGDILMKLIGNGWITKMGLGIVHVCLSKVMVHLVQEKIKKIRVVIKHFLNNIKFILIVTQMSIQPTRPNLG